MISTNSKTGIAAAICGAILFAAAPALRAQAFQLEKVQGKKILLFTPHPDDDTFCCAGTLALLAKGGNDSWEETHQVTARMGAERAHALGDPAARIQAHPPPFKTRTGLCKRSKLGIIQTPESRQIRKSFESGLARRDSETAVHPGQRE